MAEDNRHRFGRHRGNLEFSSPRLVGESPAIFAEKLSLFPEGSLVLVTDDTL